MRHIKQIYIDSRGWWFQEQHRFWNIRVGHDRPTCEHRLCILDTTTPVSWYAIEVGTGCYNLLQTHWSCSPWFWMHPSLRGATPRLRFGLLRAMQCVLIIRLDPFVGTHPTTFTPNAHFSNNIIVLIKGTDKFKSPTDEQILALRYTCVFARHVCGFRVATKYSPLQQHVQVARKVCHTLSITLLFWTKVCNVTSVYIVGLCSFEGLGRKNWSPLQHIAKVCKKVRPDFV